MRNYYQSWSLLLAREATRQIRQAADAYVLRTGRGVVGRSDRVNVRKALAERLYRVDGIASGATIPDESQRCRSIEI